MSELVLVDENQEIRKAEALVQSRYKLNPLALKLITTLISSVQSNDEIGRIYSISVSNFISIAESKNKNTYDDLKKACYEIMSKPIEIGKKNKKDFLMINWASSCEYRNGEGTIEFQISPKLFPYILNLKKGKFLTYGLENILKLNSDYSIRMYEFLKDEYNRNSRYCKKAEVIFEVGFLRERLQVPSSYDGGKFRTRVIEKAQKDLLSNCNIKFDWEVAVKLGKKVHSIKFKIYPNNKNIKEDTKLPAHLENFMKYKNYLNDKYLGNGKYFFISNFEINNKKGVYLFGINNKGLVYAISKNGGNSINLTKAQAQMIRNASYLSATYSELYRELISDDIDFWEFSKDTDNKEFFGIAIQSINSVLKEFDARVEPLF